MYELAVKCRPKNSVAAWSIACGLLLLLTDPVAAQIKSTGDRPEEVANAAAPTPTTAPSVVVIESQKSRSSVSLPKSTLQRLLPGMNPLKALHQLAGVNFQSADPWGNNEQNFSLFVHGFSAQQLGYTMDGVPLGDQQYGNYNGLSPQRAVISENVRNVILQSGAGDLATASSSNLGGTIESFSSDPRSTPHWTLAQTFGSYGTSRSYLRYDSGESDEPSPQAFYVAAVRHRARAWDFNGVQGGAQLNAKWVKHLAQSKLSAYYNFSDKTEPNEDSIVRRAQEGAVPYTRPTSYPDFAYAQAYLTPSGEPPSRDGANYSNYFGVAQRRDHLAYLKLETSVEPNSSWVNQVYAHQHSGLGAVAGPIGVAGLPALFKVYFPIQDLKDTFGGSGYAVRTTEYTIQRAGMISQWLGQTGAHQWQTGFWLERNRSSAYRRWYALDRQQPLTPYQQPSNPLITQYGSAIDTQLLQWHWQDDWRIKPNLNLQAGFKSSLQFADGRFPVQPKLGAISAGSGSSSSALPEGKINTKAWFLPQLGVLWRVDKQDQVYLNMQKNLRQFITYGAVGASPWSLNSQSAFDLFKRTAQPETAISFETGVRTQRDFSEDIQQRFGLRAFDAQVSVYQVQFRDRLLQISPSPVISSIVNGNPILSNVGSVKTQGIDLATTLQLGSHFSLFNALSYNNSRYQDNYSNGSQMVNTRSKQVPASPVWLNKSLLKANWGAFEWQLMADYVGKRYATYTNDLSVPSYLLLHLGMQYRLSGASHAGQHRISLQVSNVANRRGTSTLVVGAADSTYNSFPIPPRQVFVSLSSDF